MLYNQIKNIRRNKIVLMSICFLLLVLALLIGLMVGSYKMTPNEVVNTLLGYGDKMQNFTIFKIRLPRVCLAIVVASALGVSGGVLQGITRNPLAEPGMIGINAGAALFVVLLISAKTTAYYSSISSHTVILMPFVAMLGSLLAVALIYGFAYKKGVTPVRFILTGVGINAGITAIISFYQLSMSKGDYNQVLTWTNGSLWGSNWNYIAITTPFVLLFILIICFKSRTLDVMGLGDELATGLGVSVQKEMIFFLSLSAILAGIATAVAGNIAFLGLLGPQIAKKLFGSSHRLMLPMAACISSIILICADTIARNLFSPLEIPVGIVVSILGVPYFLYLMLKEK